MALRSIPPTSASLGDLGYYNEFRNVLGDLIDAYLLVCGKEHDLGRFSELVMSFYFDTDPDGFDAFYELEQVCSPGSPIKARPLLSFPLHCKKPPFGRGVLE